MGFLTNLSDDISFTGPFPEQGTFTLEIPEGLKDDAGRTLANQASFPLEVKTDEVPPLAKLPATFGIVELHADAALPISPGPAPARRGPEGHPRLDAARRGVAGR